MKWLLYLLLATNVALFFWGHLWREPAVAEPEAAVGVGAIRLIQEQSRLSWKPGPETPAPASPERTAQEQAAAPEVTPAPAADSDKAAPTPPPAEKAQAALQVAEAPAVVAPPAPAPEPFCLVVDGIPGDTPLDAVTGALRGQGLRVGRSARTEQVAAGFWVLVPPKAARDLAKAEAAKLRAAGIRELWIVGGGEHRNGISLGVFSTMANAKRHQADVARRGFETVVQTRMQDKEVVRLRVEGAGPGQQLARRHLQSLGRPISECR